MIWYGKEHGKRQIRPAVTAIPLRGRRLKEVDTAHQVSDGGGQSRPNGVNNPPSLAQDANTRRNRRVIAFSQRKAHRVKLGDGCWRKALKKNRAFLGSNCWIDVADDLPRLLGGPHHHARRAVGLEVETARAQEVGDTDLLQCRGQGRRPVNGAQQEVFPGMSSIHGGLPSIGRMKRIHDGIPLTTDYLADCMVRAVGYLEEQGLFRPGREDHPHVFRFATTEEQQVTTVAGSPAAIQLEDQTMGLAAIEVVVVDPNTLAYRESMGRQVDRSPQSPVEQLRNQLTHPGKGRTGSQFGDVGGQLNVAHVELVL